MYIHVYVCVYFYSNNIYTSVYINMKHIFIYCGVCFDINKLTKYTKQVMSWKFTEKTFN